MMNDDKCHEDRTRKYIILGLFRVHMVQTREQYEFLYKCVLHYLELKQKQRKLSDTAVRYGEAPC